MMKYLKTGACLVLFISYFLCGCNVKSKKEIIPWKKNENIKVTDIAYNVINDGVVISSKNTVASVYNDNTVTVFNHNFRYYESDVLKKLVGEEAFLVSVPVSYAMNIYNEKLEMVSDDAPNAYFIIAIFIDGRKDVDFYSGCNSERSNVINIEEAENVMMDCIKKHKYKFDAKLKFKSFI